MAIGEYTDTKWAGYYDVAHPDPEDEPHGVYVVDPPLGSVVAAQQRQIAEMAAELQSVSEALKETNKLAILGLAELRRKNEALESRLAHLEKMVHKQVNRGCIDDYGNEVE